MGETLSSKKKKFELPDAYVMLFILALVFAILSYIVPPGEYARITDEATGRTVVDPTSFQYLESKTPISVFSFFKAFFTAFTSMADMIFFTLIISGAFQIIRATGAIDAGIAALTRKVRGVEIVAIPILVICFSLFGCFMGSAEEMLPFYPMVISLCLALGFDSLTGVAIVLCGAGAGFAGAMMNPFTIGVAHGIAGLPAFSGLGYRAVIYVTMVIATIIVIMLYAIKIKKDPTKSLMYGQDVGDLKANIQDVAFAGRHIAVLLLFVCGIIWMAFGVAKRGWYFPELSAVFIIIGIAIGIVGKLNPDTIASNFVKGMSEMVYGACLIGVASTVSVIMSETMILDTVIHALASLIQGATPTISAVLMLFVQTLLNFFVPSGSGQASISMPIMAPLADILGVTRQTAVLCFQFGDGFSNIIYPTVGFMMAGLALGKVKWQVWIRFAWKMFLTWMLLAVLFVVIAVQMNFGPF
ncbi:MAG: YfcC family protein [Oscillospiraceae bacterium]|nr:YfcC family protein [Oscillospiraceae bacterium]